MNRRGFLSTRCYARSSKTWALRRVLLRLISLRKVQRCGNELPNFLVVIDKAHNASARTRLRQRSYIQLIVVVLDDACAIDHDIVRVGRICRDEI